MASKQPQRPAAPSAAPVPAVDLEALMRSGAIRASHERGMWQMTNLAGQHGDGRTPQEAYDNVGSVIVPGADGRRVRIRASGEEVPLDEAGKPSVVDPNEPDFGSDI